MRNRVHQCESVVVVGYELQLFAACEHHVSLGALRTSSWPNMRPQSQYTSHGMFHEGRGTNSPLRVLTPLTAASLDCKFQLKAAVTSGHIGRRSLCLGRVLFPRGQIVGSTLAGNLTWSLCCNITF